MRTDRSISQFILEFPVCTIDSTFEALKQKGDALIRSVEDLIAEDGRVSEEEAEYLRRLIDQMQQASNSDEYHLAYDDLLKEYNRLITES